MRLRRLIFGETIPVYDLEAGEKFAARGADGRLWCYDCWVAAPDFKTISARNFITGGRRVFGVADRVTWIGTADVWTWTGIGDGADVIADNGLVEGRDWSRVPSPGSFDTGAADARNGLIFVSHAVAGRFEAEERMP